ncbi:MAG: iron(III) transport system ATP-binding protein [Bradyrhizobium sp.]|nr:iron(III) transport system ATP-binding protein [Bradyrhizobium sp.]
MSRLKLSGVSKRFGDFLAVDGIDLELKSGEFVSLLGPSGCGKTTTLRMIAGFVDPTLGTIEMDDKILSSPAGSVPPDRRQMSMIFQSYAIWPNMTVEQNVAFGLELRKIASAEVKRRVGEMLEVVHMNHLADRYPSELSGGQQQRVALARAIVIRPSVLLLDEPLSNLDATLREEMRFEIRRLHDEFHVTTVYVTHDQAEAMVTSDRIAVMNHGRIEQVDHPRALYNKPKTRFVAGFIGRTNFIEGTSNGQDISFDGFALPRAGFEREVPSGAKAVFSVRPHSLRLSDAPSAARNGCASVGVVVVERAFLGEHWDYVVRPRESALTLRVTTSPMDDFAVGASAWLEFEPRQMALIP